MDALIQTIFIGWGPVLTADSNTLSGQEPEPQHRNPYREDVRSAGPGPVPPAADPKQTRFSAAAITGMVLVSIAWAIVFSPLITFISRGGSFHIIDLYAYLGPIALLGGVTGFIVELIKGNRNLAARLYIIPSLIWQGGLLAALVLLLIALAGYDAT